MKNREQYHVAKPVVHAAKVPCERLDCFFNNGSESGNKMIKSCFGNKKLDKCKFVIEQDQFIQNLEEDVMRAFFGSPDGPYVVRLEFRHEMMEYYCNYIPLLK